MANVNNIFPLLIFKFHVVKSASENACKHYVAPMERTSNGSWIIKNSDRIVDMKYLWNSRSPYGEDINKCTGFSANDGKYYATTCNTKQCLICAWKDSPLFTLRGLCTNTQVDDDYVLLPAKNFGGNVFGEARHFFLEKYSLSIFCGFIQKKLMFGCLSPAWTLF